MPEPKAPLKKTSAPKATPAVVGLSLSVVGLDGVEKKQITLSKDIFTAPVDKKLLANYVHVYLTNQRQGTVSAKTRAEVQASTRKIYRQKGTGRARHGAKTAALFRGGGVTFGPKPKEYHLKMNKKQKIQALSAALSLAFKNKILVGLTEEAIKIKPKTSAVVAFLKTQDYKDAKILMVLPKMEKNNLLLASRNISNVAITDAPSLNPYEILNTKKIIFVESALPILENRFKAS